MQTERGHDLTGRCGATATSRAFLLRCWREERAGPGGGPAWRFAVTEVGPEQKRRGFACLEGLMAFLEEELIGDADPRAEAGGGETAT
jgi:hypothetical protein